jgi:Fe2+ or Zn2+ uptake regulation protein
VASTQRNTRQRTALLEALRATRAHPTAEALYAALKNNFPRLSLSTVYRNLNLLETQGLIHRLGCGSGPDRYEAAIGDHAHLRCRSCGKIEDYMLPDETALQRSVARRTGFRIESRQLDLTGLCRDCARKS